MNIGIIVFSQTGTTLSVAQKLKEKLSSGDNPVNIERVTHKGGDKVPNENVELDMCPDVDKYDVLVFCSPVWAFSLSFVMKAYLQQISSLQNKKVALFVTKSLPFSWTGGNNAINQMKEIVKSKNADICGTDMIRSNKINDDIEINNMIEKLIKSLGMVKG
jgi:flavodoxin